MSMEFCQQCTGYHEVGACPISTGPLAKIDLMQIEVIPEAKPISVRKRGRPRGSQDPQGIASRAQQVGLSVMTVYQRIHRGWTIEEALSTPKSGRRQVKPVTDVVQQATEHAENKSKVSAALAALGIV